MRGVEGGGLDRRGQVRRILRGLKGVEQRERVPEIVARVELPRNVIVRRPQHPQALRVLVRHRGVGLREEGGAEPPVPRVPVGLRTDEGALSFITTICSSYRDSQYKR